MSALVLILTHTHRNPALHLPIPAVLPALHELGIHSLMVEGGAQVIASFFATSSVVDSVIVTVAPTFVGADGVGYGLPLGVVCFSLPFSLFRSRIRICLVSRLPIRHHRNAGKRCRGSIYRN